MPNIDEVTQQYAANRPVSMSLFKQAQESLAGGVGHDLRYSQPVPMYIDHASGSRKWDVDGNEYVDFLMGNGALMLGHADRDVVAAVRAAAEKGTHFGNDHPLHIEWARLVQQLLPSADRVRFVNSGTEATHLAIRLARAFTGRSRSLRFEGHFHGWHDEMVHGFQPPFDADGSLGVPPGLRETIRMIPDGNAELVEEELAGDSDIAAVILEPSGASWGRVPLDPDFLRALREITLRNGVQLIFDEVITGFRFSPGGAQGLYEIVPDLTSLAKIVAGGMPGGAVAGRADIMRLFDITGDAHHDRHQRVAHQGTFNAAPLSAAAGVVALNKIATGKPIDQANDMARMLRSRWNAVLERHGIAGYVYGQCSTFHVYFETDKARINSAQSSDDLRTGDAMRLKGMSQELIDAYQLLLRHLGVDLMSSTGGVLSSVHTEPDIDAATDAFEKTIGVLKDQQLIHTL